jgi:hypothetical protein
MDRHNRPYMCESANCRYTKGFGSRGELKRHINSVHKQTNLFCSVTGCSYSCPRKDNLQDHINRRHKDHILEHPATPQGDRNSPAGNQDIPSSDFSRQASPADQVDVTVRSARKRRRMPDYTMSLENAGSTNEELYGLREENKKLRQENGALERELELYKKREDRWLKLSESIRSS